MSAQDRTAVSRRHALKSGALATLAAGLLGAARPAEAVLTEQPITVAGVVDTAPLAAESRHQAEIVRRSLDDVSAAEDAIRATLTPEQAALFDRYEAALSAHVLDAADLDMSELRRHLPGLAPMLAALWEHVRETGSPGECCLPLARPNA